MRNNVRRTIWRTALLIGIMIILTACATTKQIMPTKPTLTAIQNGEMICFSRADAVLLGRYIIDLERAAK